MHQWIITPSLPLKLHWYKPRCKSSQRRLQVIYVNICWCRCPSNTGIQAQQMLFAQLPSPEITRLPFRCNLQISRERWYWIEINLVRAMYTPTAASTFNAYTSKWMTSVYSMDVALDFRGNGNHRDQSLWRSRHIVKNGNLIIWTEFRATKSLSQQLDEIGRSTPKSTPLDTTIPAWNAMHYQSADYRSN